MGFREKGRRGRDRPSDRLDRSRCGQGRNAGPWLPYTCASLLAGLPPRMSDRGAVPPVAPPTCSGCPSPLTYVGSWGGRVTRVAPRSDSRCCGLPATARTRHNPCRSTSACRSPPVGGRGPNPRCASGDQAITPLGTLLHQSSDHSPPTLATMVLSIFKDIDFASGTRHRGGTRTVARPCPLRAPRADESAAPAAAVRYGNPS